MDSESLTISSKDKPGTLKGAFQFSRLLRVRRTDLQLASH